MLYDDPLTSRPQDPSRDGAGWTYRTAAHGGDVDDAMPQAIIATDANGVSRVYAAYGATLQHLTEEKQHARPSEQDLPR